MSTACLRCLPQFNSNLSHMSGAAGPLETDVDETQRTRMYCTSMAYSPGFGGFVQSFTPLYRALGGNWTSVCLETSKAPLARKNVKLPLKSQEEETKAVQTNWLCNIAKWTHLGSKSSFIIDDHSKVDVFWLNKMLIKIGYWICPTLSTYIQYTRIGQYIL